MTGTQNAQESATKIAMVTLCLVILAISVAAFVLALRGVRDGWEDKRGFHPAP